MLMTSISYAAPIDDVTFYDASVETHAVVTNVLGFGVTNNGTNDNDSVAFQAAIDYVAAQPGGGDLVVPAGDYVLSGVYPKSNVHILIDKDATLILPYGFMFIYESGGATPLTNLSMRGVGGKFTVLFPSLEDQPAGVSDEDWAVVVEEFNSGASRFIKVHNVHNFYLGNFHVIGNYIKYSTVILTAEGNSFENGGFAHNGTIENISADRQSVGYGLIQIHAAESVLAINLWVDGGVCFRLESGVGSNDQFGGLNNVYGRDLTALNSLGAMLVGPHGHQNGYIDVDGVVVSNSVRGVGGSDGHVVDRYTNYDVLPGTYANGSILRNVEVYFGTNAPLSSKSLSTVAPDLQHLIRSDIGRPYSASDYLGPSLYGGVDGALMWDLEFEGMKIHGNGLQRYAPISTDYEKGYGITEENFHWKDFGLTLDSEWWAVTTNMNAGGTNWLSGNGDAGLLDTTVAGQDNHGLNYWGFSLEDDADADIESDFRYYHQSGGDVGTGMDQAAFGLMLSTDADPASGTNRFSVLANQGAGIGLLGHAGDLAAHTNLNVDTSLGGWSDWFRLKWHIDQGTVNYQGTASLYDSAGNLLFTGPTTDLGIPNGTKIWAGYTTGPNSGGGTVSSFSGLGAVQVDNFHYEKGFINDVPVWVVEKARMYTMVNTPLVTSFPVNSNLRGFIHEPDGTYVVYSKLSGPDWLSIDEKGTLQGTPSLFDIGENEFTILIEDPEGLSATGQVSVTVSPLSGGSFSLLPIDDHSVDSLNPTNNILEGTGRALTVQKNRKEAFLKFDLSAVSGDVVTNAFLRLKVSDPDDNMLQTAWFVSDDSWQQETLVYSNKPAFTAALASDFPVPVKDWWVELDVTDQIQNEWSGDQLFSIGFSSANGFKAGYHSREAIPGYRPELVVQTANTNNAAPVDPGRVIVGQGAMENSAYAVNLNDVVTDPDEDTMFFQIVSGPAWLSVDLDGTTSGTPLAGDVGVNSWEILVTDALNGWTPAVLKISVFLAGSTDHFILNPTADSYVRAGAKTNVNYGTGSSLLVRGGGSREAYLKFDLSAVPGDVFDAVLRLKVTPESSTSPDNQTAYFIPDDSWGETHITWDTKPPAGTALDSALRPGIGSWMELDVTDQVRSEWAGDGAFSVALHSSLTEITYYHSREADAADRPQLVITAGHTGWSEFIQAYGLSGVGTDDTDLDGLTDLQEFARGGNPTNPAVFGSSPWIVYQLDDNVGFHYLAPAYINPGITYHPQWVTNLVTGPWSNVFDFETQNPNPMTDYNETKQTIYGGTNDHLFFRLDVTKP